MTRFTSVESKIVWRINNYDAKVIMPQPIDNRSCEQWVVSGNPVGKGESAFCILRIFREFEVSGRRSHRSDTSGDHCLSSLFRVSSEQDECFIRFFRCDSVD